LSGEEREGIMPKVTSWEIELWSYLSSGDGKSCPVSNCCQSKGRGGWCLDENKESINCLLDEREFDFHSHDFMGSEAEGICRLGQLVERLAQKYLKKTKVCCPPLPSGIVSLADLQRCIEIHTLPLKYYHGAIWRLNDRWVVQLKGDDTSSEKRFTMFHETFHILAHRGGTPVFKKRRLEQGSFNELLADHFASCMLMPREWVKEKWAEIQNLDRMAEIFAVPKSAMYMRLRYLGLI
jgi:hypothetical protein